MITASIYKTCFGRSYFHLAKKNRFWPFVTSPRRINFYVENAGVRSCRWKIENSLASSGEIILEIRQLGRQAAADEQGVALVTWITDKLNQT